MPRNILDDLQQKLVSQNEGFHLRLLQLRVVLSNCPEICLQDPFGADLTATLLRLFDSFHFSESKESIKHSQDMNHSTSSLEKRVASISCVVQCLALMANKHEEHSETERLIIETLTGGRCNAKAVEGTERTSCSSLMAAYLAKGLLMRGHRFCEKAVEITINNVSVDVTCAKNFALIVRSEPRIFPREGHCIVRLLFPQRLLTFALPQLLQGFEKGTESGSNFLIKLTADEDFFLRFNNGPDSLS